MLTSSLSFVVGIPHNKALSKRPGRSKAGSIKSGRLYGKP